ncbi:MAG: hypothetical protein ACQEQL_07220 [Pseudomonadota bacterium]
MSRGPSFFDEILLIKSGFDNSENIDETFIENLEAIERRFYSLKKRDNPAPLLKLFIDLTNDYLSAMADKTEQDNHKQIAEKYSVLSFYLSHRALAGKNQPNNQRMAIGILVQALVHCGMAKGDACETIANWIKIPQKTTGNPVRYTSRKIEQFNQLYREQHNPENFTDFFIFSPYSMEINELILNNPDFANHTDDGGNAAFEEMLCLLSIDYKELKKIWSKVKKSDTQDP